MVKTVQWDDDNDYISDYRGGSGSEDGMSEEGIRAMMVEVTRW